jgi:hypothetical protein
MSSTFDLPEADVEHLRARGLSWETRVEGAVRWLIISEWPVPPGYNCQTVDLALRIEAGYPTTQIDMAYFSPALSRKDGKPIRAISVQLIGRKQFQRWSRHRTISNPWRPGEDDLSTHLLLVEDWLCRELTKGVK